MATGAISAESKKISELRVVDLKSELKRRSLDTTGVKSVLQTRLRQALEDEDGDTENIEIQLSTDTSTRKSGKVKGKKVDSDADTTGEEDVLSKETEEYESEKDITDTDDGTRENSKPAPSEDSLAQPEAEALAEAEPESEAVAAEADSEPDPEVDAEADPEVDAEAEPEVDAEAKPEVDAETEPDIDAELEVDADADPEEDEDADPEVDEDADPERDEDADPEMDGEAEPEVETELDEMDDEAMNSSKEAEDDHLSVSIPNEDAITLDVDGDDLLETGKHVKLPDPEAEKGTDEPEASAETGRDDDMKAEETGGHKDGKKDDGSRGEPAKKDGREALKKAETGDKEKDSGKKGPSATGASGQAKSSSRDRDGKGAKDEKGVVSSSNSSSSRNIWVSGLSSNTKAADLKNLFGKYGKVLSAKVVTNARSPGAKCYGLVTMSSSTEVTRCVSHLDCTELHGQQIYVERAKNDPFKKEGSKKEAEDKASSSKSSDKRSSTGVKPTNKAQPSYKKEEKKVDKVSEKDKDLSKKQEVRGGKSESGSSNSGQDLLKKDDRKYGRPKSPGKMMMVHHPRADSNFGKMRPFRRGRYFDKPFVNMNVQRRPKWLIPPEELEMMRDKQRHFPNKGEDILPFEKMKEQRMRERVARLERVRRAVELRRRREIAEQERRERERIRLLREREERENLLRERQRLEMERQKLERERLERERLERERIRIEQERRKEAERMAREREELRRQQEQLRYEQEKRNNLKRGREVEHGRRDDSYWNGNKKMQSESDVRLNQGSNYNRQQNRFSNFTPRERGRFPEAAAEQPNTYDRRNRFDGEPEVKKSRPAPHRESSGFERYPKTFETVRRAEPPPPPRTELRDTDRRDRDERRPVPMHDRPMGARATMPGMSHNRSPRDGGHGWKNDGGINTNKGDIRNAGLSRGPMRMRPERSGREGPGPVLRGGSSASRGRSSFNDRAGGRPMVMNDQPFSSGRQVVVERHSRDQGLRKEWHGASSSQGGGYQDNRRMGDSRGSMMAPSSHSSSGMNRIVQITNNSIPSGGNVGGFKPFKGTPRQF
ncbi:SAFB-like transcription modulator isoform X1 [Sebastes umbrosus]|uniref:SAFB-like transcription modulator isoform X1 n=1 Tax=Sebastes umbrosus TaxID=72105 RepID=UPI00189D45D1|nr:SAFB-like transcription modulator isoform X1 [Sebastes umbrosus]